MVVWCLFSGTLTWASLQEGNGFLAGGASHAFVSVGIVILKKKKVREDKLKIDAKQKNQLKTKNEYKI